jgi:hypothetical protein
MEWLILILLLAALGRKPPSAVHDPEGYKAHQGCMAILGIIFLILMCAGAGGWK